MFISKLKHQTSSPVALLLNFKKTKTFYDMNSSVQRIKKKTQQMITCQKRNNKPLIK